MQEIRTIINYGSALVCGYSSLGEECSQVGVRDNTFQSHSGKQTLARNLRLFLSSKGAACSKGGLDDSRVSCELCPVPPL